MKQFWVALAMVALATARGASLVDTTFNVGAGANGIVEQVLMQPDGKVLICGNFTAFNNVEKPYMARLNANGSLDTTFDARPSYWTRHMALQPDGKIVIGGFFTSVSGVSRRLIARLNANGSLDTSFNPGLGMTNSLGTAIDGNIDPFVFWVDVQGDGKILATGNFRTYNNEGSVGLVRINPDGTRDGTFNVGQGLDSWGRTIKIQSDQKIILGGWFTSYNGSGANRLVRINPDGTRDTSLNAFYGDKTAIYSIVIQPNGQLITSGHSLNELGLFSREVVRLNANGSVDESWVGFTNEKTECMWMQPDGSVIVAGYFNRVNGVTRRGLARWTANGQLDANFVADTDNYVWTVTPGPPGKIYVSGGFNTVDGISSRGVARINLPEGTTPITPPPAPPTITSPRLFRGRFECVVNTSANYTYILQYKATPGDSNWISLASVTGNGSAMLLVDPTPASPRFYRVEAR